LEINLKKFQLLSPWDLGDYNIQTSKFFFFGVIFTMNFFTPKLMKIRWSFLFWGSFAWAKILFVDGGLESKLQHYGPCKISWKKSKTSHSDYSSHIEGDIIQNHEQKKFEKGENPRFNGQNKLLS
jgi:hypothetical protein